MVKPYFMHILSIVTDNNPSWMSGRMRIIVEIVSWSISTKVWDRAWIELATPGSVVYRLRERGLVYQVRQAHIHIKFDTGQNSIKLDERRFISSWGRSYSYRPESYQVRSYSYQVGRAQIHTKFAAVKITIKLGELKVIPSLKNPRFISNLRQL